MTKETYDATPALHEIVQDVSQKFFLMGRSTSPLLMALGWPDRLVRCHSTKVEWKQAALRANGSTVPLGFTAGAGSFAVAAGEGSRFRINDLIQADGSREIMLVTNVVTDTLTVTRGYGGTTAALGLANVRVLRLSNVKDESPSLTAVQTDRVAKDNYTQEFKDSADVSDSMQNVELHAGIEDELDFQVTEIQQNLLRDIAHAVIRGIRKAASPEGATGSGRTMDGLLNLITGSDAARFAAGGAALDEAQLNTMLQDVWGKGGNPTILAASPDQKRALSAIIEGRTRWAASDHAAGVKVDRFQSDFGDLEVILDYFVPTDVVLALDPTRIALRKLDKTGRMNPFEVTDLARTTSSTQKLVRAEYSLEIHNGDDGGHGVIEGLAV